MPLNKLIDSTAWSIAVAGLLLSTACSELVTPPQSEMHVDASARKIFFANGDGTYTWDGTSVPAGDLSPADIVSATAGAYAPRAGTGGWVSGKMLFNNGDQYKMDLTYSVMNTITNKPFYSNSTTSTDWTFGIPGAEKYYNLDLHLDPLCGYSVTTGGTAYARKAVPFRIGVSLIKLPALSAFSIGFGTVTWGDAPPMPMTAASDNGITCPRTVSTVTVSGGSSVYIGEALSLSAAATDNRGASASDLCSSFTWSSADASVASVSGGSVMGVGTGSTTISATCSGVTGSVAVSSSLSPIVPACGDPAATNYGVRAACTFPDPGAGGGSGGGTAAPPAYDPPTPPPPTYCYSWVEILNDFDADGNVTWTYYVYHSSCY